mmetsp:Transcript_26458/g.84152  ORF Transcript_26458/g.84152 Transcript_26458/m.84152 type:complete len:666 (+) Transcript_26458:136-2133(+)
MRISRLEPGPWQSLVDQIPSPDLTTGAGQVGASEAVERQGSGSAHRRRSTKRDHYEDVIALRSVLEARDASKHRAAGIANNDRVEPGDASLAEPEPTPVQATTDSAPVRDDEDGADMSEGSADASTTGEPEEDRDDHDDFPPFPFPSLPALRSIQEQRRILPQVAAWFGYRLIRAKPEDLLPHVRQIRAAEARGETIEEYTIKVKKKRVADPEDPNPRKRPRRTWTPSEKETIVNASRNGSSTMRLVASAMGMNINTARNIVQRAAKRHEDSYIDRRSGPHPNHPTKCKEKYLDWLRGWLEENCTLPLNTLTARLNQEISREVLIKYGADLLDKERDFGEDFEFELHEFYESNQLAKAEYKAHRINAPTTVGRWLANMLFTRKVALQERSTANNETNKRERLEFCKTLLLLMNSREEMLIFTDEMPFHVRQMRSYGRAKIGTRAVVQTAPGSTLALRTQVALAVHSELGIVHDVVCPPERLSKSELAVKTGEWRHQWKQVAFVSFMDGLLTKLVDIVDEANTLVTKNVNVILDGAPEHGASAMQQVRALESCKRLQAKLASTGNQLRFLELPPISPMVNLTDSYNQTLRGISQRFLDTPENQQVMLSPPKGEAIRSRLDVLQRAIEFGVGIIKTEHSHLISFSNLSEFVADVIAHQGRLDFSKYQ